MTDLPLTERILARLPGPRAAWIILWAILVLIRPAVFTLVVRWAGHDAGCHPGVAV